MNHATGIKSLPVCSCPASYSRPDALAVALRELLTHSALPNAMRCSLLSIVLGREAGLEANAHTSPGCAYGYPIPHRTPLPPLYQIIAAHPIQAHIPLYHGPVHPNHFIRLCPTIPHPPKLTARSSQVDDQPSSRFGCTLKLRLAHWR